MKRRNSESLLLSRETYYTNNPATGIEACTPTKLPKLDRVQKQHTQVKQSKNDENEEEYQQHVITSLNITNKIALLDEENIIPLQQNNATTIISQIPPQNNNSAKASSSQFLSIDKSGNIGATPPFFNSAQQVQYAKNYTDHQNHFENFSSYQQLQTDRLKAVPFYRLSVNTRNMEIFDRQNKFLEISFIFD